MIKKCLAVLVCAALLALPFTADSRIIQYYRMFNAYDVDATSYVYNSSAGTGAIAGQLDVEGAKSLMIMVGVTTLVSDAVTISIQGKSALGTNWAEIYTKAYSAALTSVTYDPILITEPVHFIRVGLKVGTDAGTDAVTIIAVWEE